MVSPMPDHRNDPIMWKHELDNTGQVVRHPSSRALAGSLVESGAYLLVGILLLVWAPSPWVVLLGVILVIVGTVLIAVILVQLGMRDPAVTVDELGLQVRNTKVAWPEITDIALVPTDQRLWAIHRRHATEIEVAVTPQAQRRLDRGADRTRNGGAGLTIPGTYDFDPETFVSWLQELRGHYGGRRTP
jgi:hypothetical protein